MVNKLQWPQIPIPADVAQPTARSRSSTCHCTHPHALRQAHDWYQRQLVMRVMAKCEVGILALSFVSGIPERTLRHWRAEWERVGWVPRSRERVLRRIAAMASREAPGKTEPGDGRSG